MFSFRFCDAIIIIVSVFNGNAYIPIVTYITIQQQIW